MLKPLEILIERLFLFLAILDPLEDIHQRTPIRVHRLFKLSLIEVGHL